MKRIIYANNEGGISIVIPSPAWEGTIEELAQKDVPDGKQFKIIDTADVPVDREFRNAWEYDEGIKINIEKAKVIHADRLRAARKPLLEALDVEYVRAIETGADTKDIIVEKQRLRDITEPVKDCKTIEEIKAIKIATEVA